MRFSMEEFRACVWAESPHLLIHPQTLDEFLTIWRDFTNKEINNIPSALQLLSTILSICRRVTSTRILTVALKPGEVAIATDDFIFQVERRDEQYAILGVQPNWAQTPRINLADVHFTQHALDQFCIRHKERTGRELHQPLRTAFRLLGAATENGSISKRRRKQRKRNHGGVEARYFLKDPWRFVIVEGEEGLTVVTIEIYQHDESEDEAT